jgi:hypothetical protein
MDLKKFHWILILLFIVFISIFLGRKTIYEGAIDTTDNTVTTSISIEPTDKNVPDVDKANSDLQTAKSDYNKTYATYLNDSNKLKNDKEDLSKKQNDLEKLIKDIDNADNTITQRNNDLAKLVLPRPWPKDGSSVKTDYLNFYYPLTDDFINYAIGKQDIMPFNEAAINDRSLALDERAAQSIILPPIKITPNFSVACWVNTNSGNKWARIFDLGNDATGNNLVAYIGNNGYIGFGTPGFLGEVQKIANTGWKHIAWIFDDTSGKRKGLIYIDGNLVKQIDGNSAPINIEFKSNFIGQSNWINDPFLAGNVSDFRIYNRALNSDEVNKLAKFNKPTTSSPTYQPIDSNVKTNAVGLEKGPIVKLLLDGNANNTGSKNDIQVNNGNPNSPVAFGKYCNKPCAIFNDNIQNYLTFPFKNDINNTPKFSFCYWMYVPASDNTYYTLISYTNANWIPSIQADIGYGNNIRMVFAFPNHWKLYDYTEVDYRNKWTHITYTVDQTTSSSGKKAIAQLYVNGKLVAKVDGDNPTMYNPDRFIIGRSGDNNRGFRGGISDFRIYDKILSPNKINIIYNEGGGGDMVSCRVNNLKKQSAIKCSQKDRFCISNETDANGVQNYYCYGSTSGCLWHVNDCDSDEKCKQKYVNPDGSYKTDKRYTDRPNGITTTCSSINSIYPDAYNTAWPKQACSISSNPLNLDPALIVYYRFNIGDSNGTDLYNFATIPPVADAKLINGASISSSDPKAGSGSLFLNAAQSQYVKIANLTTGNNGLTFAFWFKSNRSGPWARIFDFGNGPSSDNIDFTVSMNGTSKPGFEVYNSGSSLEPTINVNHNNNVWYHYVWTLTYSAYNSRNSTWKIYTNGNFTSTYNNNYYPKDISRSNLFIGKSNWNDAYFNGYMGNFRIYSRVLNDAEITSLYNYNG